MGAGVAIVSALSSAYGVVESSKQQKEAVARENKQISRQKREQKGQQQRALAERTQGIDMQRRQMFGSGDGYGIGRTGATGLKKQRNNSGAGTLTGVSLG